jgi:hypothetical protein
VPVYVTVCDACLRASCWQGTLFCDEALNAGTRLVDVKVLGELDLEHPEYWEKNRETHPRRASRGGV